MSNTLNFELVGKYSGGFTASFDTFDETGKAQISLDLRTNFKEFTDRLKTMARFMAVRSANISGGSGTAIKHFEVNYSNGWLTITIEAVGTPTSGEVKGYLLGLHSIIM